MTHIPGWLHEAPKPVHDPESIFQAMHDVRRAYCSISARRCADATIRNVLDELDRIASDLHTELTSCQPHLPPPTTIVAAGIDRKVVP